MSTRIGYVFAVLATLCFAKPAFADAFLFGASPEPGLLKLTLQDNTSLVLFTDGSLNQSGYWTDTGLGFHSFHNATYLVGTLGSTTYHNYFTFDLSTLAAPVTSAMLELYRWCGNTENTPGCSFSGGPSSVTYSLWDVTTDPNTLDNGTNNLAVYDDLGSGVNYGSYVVGTGPGYDDSALVIQNGVDRIHNILGFNLNEQGVQAINAARGSYFSLGGSVPVPEASTLTLLIAGLTSLLLRYKRVSC